jgi:YCII-related domain
MTEYIFFMHNDIADDRLEKEDGWPAYIATLKAAGCFRGGSAIGGGVCARNTGVPSALANHMTGFIRIEAANLTEAQRWLQGNPDFEAGGTVEIRELLRSD